MTNERLAGIRGSEPDGFKSVRLCLEQGISEGVFPGCVLLAAAGEKVLFLESAGLVDGSEKCAPTRTTAIFDVASLTKPLATALSISLLIKEGIIDWQTPAAGIFGKYMAGPLAQSGATISHLLSHSAGLPAFRPYYHRLKKSPRKDPKDWVRRQITKENLLYEPGTKSLYSDLGYIMLEWVVEYSSGRKLDTFVQNHITAPLALERTGFWTQSNVSPDRSEFVSTGRCRYRERTLQGEVHDRNAFVVGGVSGHAGLFSTAPEIHALLARIYGSYSGMDESLLPRAVTRRMVLRYPAFIKTTWALGFDTPSPKNSSAGKYFSVNSIGHLGFTGVSFWMDLTNGLIIVFLTNRTAETHRSTAIRSFRPQIHELAYQAALSKI